MSLINIAKILIGVILFLASISSASADALGDYIQKHCKTNCVDTGLFRMVLYEVKEAHGVDPVMMAAIVQVESSFNTRAVNRTNGKSIGLSQIQVRWHTDKFITKHYHDVFDNVHVGAVVYRDCLKRHRGVARKALWCYNGHQKTGMKKYVPKVLKSYYLLKKEGVRI